MRNRAKKTLLTGAVVLLIGCAYLVLYQITGIGIPCPFRWVTHLNCPGCGITRAALKILQLDFVGAVKQNAFLVPIVLYVGWIFFYTILNLSIIR